MPPGTAPRPHAPLVVAIDGPAGAGKTTVARGVARALGLDHLDTGAMYRAVTAKALGAGVDPADERALVALARRTRIEFRGGSLTVDGRRVGPEARSRKVNRLVSAVSAHAGVRRELVRVQREILRRGRVVAEGRDIGTVVYPRAPVKVFLTASVDERARRRHREIERMGERVALETLRREIARRDALDSTRQVSPLVPATDATILDSTGKTPRRVVAEIAMLVRRFQDAAARRRRGARRAGP